MNIEPYELLKDANGNLNIALIPLQAKRLRTYHLWLPSIVLICSIFFLFFLNKNDIAGWLKWLPFLAAIASLFLLFTKYRVSVNFTDHQLLIRQKVLGLNFKTTYKITDLKTVAFNSNESINYVYVFTKKDKNKTLFTFWGEKNNGNELIKMISEQTGLPIQKK